MAINDEGKEKIDIKYFKMIALPYVRPVANRLDWFFDKLGYASKREMFIREGLLAVEYNKFIYNTIVRDRQQMMDKHIEGLQKIHESVYLRMDQLREENDQLRLNYENFEREMDSKEKILSKEENKLKASKDKLVEYDELKKQLALKEGEIQKLQRQLMDSQSSSTSLGDLPKLIPDDGLTEEYKNKLAKLGYQLLMKFPNLEKVQTNYYVRVEGVETPDHAGLKALVFEEIKSKGYAVEVGVGSDADIIYRTGRGKKMGVEILTAGDLKEWGYTTQRINYLKKIYKELYGVTTEEDVSQFSQVGINVIPYFDFPKKL
jgi:hypothetical protein